MLNRGLRHDWIVAHGRFSTFELWDCGFGLPSSLPSTAFDHGVWLLGPTLVRLTYGPPGPGPPQTLAP